MTNTIFLSQAIATLEEAFKLYENSSGSQALLMRDGLIQRFEYTFELAVKTLERFLKQVMISESELLTVTYNDLIRIGAEKSLILNPECWFEFRLARNRTSHAYSGKVADEVFEVIPKFLGQVILLLSNLQQIENRN